MKWIVANTVWPIPGVTTVGPRGDKNRYTNERGIQWLLVWPIPGVTIVGPGGDKNRRVNEREYVSFGVAARLSFAPHYLNFWTKLNTVLFYLPEKTK